MCDLFLKYNCLNDEMVKIAPNIATAILGAKYFVPKENFDRYFSSSRSKETSPYCAEIYAKTKSKGECINEKN